MQKGTRAAVAFLLLCCSNIFMTTAWYLHLKKESWGIAKAIFISWLIASVEYMLQVPANRIGHVSHGGPFTAPVLKMIQEFISLTVFGFFSTYVLKEKLRWTDGVGLLLIFAGVSVSMGGREWAARNEGGGGGAAAYQRLDNSTGQVEMQETSG